MKEDNREKILKLSEHIARKSVLDVRLAELELEHGYTIAQAQFELEYNKLKIELQRAKYNLEMDKHDLEVAKQELKSEEL